MQDTLCMGLHLDVLHSQCLQLESQVCGGFVQVEEYLPGEVLRISYWRPFGSSHSLSAFLQQTQCKWSVCACLHVCMCVCARTRVCACVCVWYVCVCTLVCKYICMCVFCIVHVCIL